MYLIFKLVWNLKIIRDRNLLKVIRVIHKGNGMGGTGMAACKGRRERPKMKTKEVTNIERVGEDSGEERYRNKGKRKTKTETET